MKDLIIKIQFTLFALFILSGVNADTVNFSADTTGQPTWNRTNQDCSTLSVIGTAVSFHTQEFSISNNDSCTLNATETSGQDMYLHLYNDPFDPNNQAVNCVNTNDDGGGAFNSQITNEPLVSGQTYVMVTSGFGNTSVGGFDASISCPTAIVSLARAVVPSTSIPTLSTWAMLLLLLTLVLASTYFRRPQK